MADDRSSKRLGRGLAALIGEMDQPESATEPVVREDRAVPIELVSPNPNNPRRAFSQTEIDELASSLREHGLIQPIVVRTARGRDGYEIVAGERRWRAAQRAGLLDIPVIIRDVDDKAALELAIVENVQRADLNPIEEAAGYQQLIDEHGYTQADLGDVIGKSRSHVANTLRLLKLPQDVQALVADGSLSSGHARCLVTAADPMALARRIVEEGLSVRQAEALAQVPAGDKAANGGKAKPDKDADTLSLEKALSDATGYRVAISHGAKGGEVRIRYRSLEQLDDLCRLLQRQ
ncbi:MULTISPECIES: ParB/RepB/Spo0J family partition protein [unclassified Roseitalea]|uniref:ParB/RepB/Spo0J family partition protein n=1 Tax=unclassified Roseitalea TaxID=2639107 RepID=UPI00273E8766|nr:MULTISPECIES: ParB/RepB/Spo0J family partition protein [unclassified Roseitalea]